MSELERTIAHYRSAVLSRDTAALTRLELAYQESLDRLRPTIELLQQQVNGLDDPKPGDVFRLDRYTSLERMAVNELDRIAHFGTAQVAVEQTRMLSLGADAALDLAVVQGGIRVAQAWTRVPPSKLERLIGLMSDGSRVADLFREIAESIVAGLRTAVTKVMGVGRNLFALGEAVFAAINRTKVRAMSTSRNAIMDTFRHATIRQYAANVGTVLEDEWEWASRKDKSVCPSCLWRDGQRFSVNEPFMKRHTRCRCVPLPVVKGVNTNRQRAADWLIKQSPSVQNRVLGSGAAGDAYRAGELTLSDFVKQTNHPRWGESYQADSLVGARARAEQRRQAA